jgi:energy-coupling factor transporter ATP-binding protein EcfA2
MALTPAVRKIRRHPRPARFAVDRARRLNAAGGKSLAGRDADPAPLARRAGSLNHSGARSDQEPWRRSSCRRRRSPRPQSQAPIRKARPDRPRRAGQFRCGFRAWPVRRRPLRRLRICRQCAARGKLVACDTVLETEHLTKDFAGFVAVRAVNLRIARGAIHAMIGPNGAGKTTCFNLLSKFLKPTRGRIVFDGCDITALEPRLGLVRSFQISAVFPHMSVLENVRIALQRRRGGSFDFWRSSRLLRALGDRARALIAEVGLAPCAGISVVEPLCRRHRPRLGRRRQAGDRGLQPRGPRHEGRSGQRRPPERRPNRNIPATITCSRRRSRPTRRFVR